MNLLVPGIARSHIYFGFTGRVSTLQFFPPKPGCKGYSILDQTVEEFEQGLDSVLTDSPELDASLAEFDACLLQSSQAFSTQLDCSLLLASNLINYGARLELSFCLFHRQVKCQLLS